jgi:anti-sigma-K factor RskA
LIAAAAMAAELNNEKLIRQYLLGGLTEEQQVPIEDRAFADKDYLASITAVENDLIDEYVRQELSDAERERFEQRFLASAERRKRLEFAKALVTVISEEPATEKRVRAWSWRDSLYAFLSGLNPAARVAFVAASILLVVGAAWLFTQTLRLRRQVTQLEAQRQSQQKSLQQDLERERKRSEELNARLAQEKQQREQTEESLRELGENADTTNPPPRPVIASLTLLAGVARGGGVKPVLSMTDDVRLVRLQIGIDPEEQYKTFAADLRSVSGRSIWTRENLSTRTRRGARTLTLTLPATALKPGDYELALRGITDTSSTEDVGFYYFKVKKK